MDDFDDFDGLFADMDRDAFADDVGDVVDDGGDGLTDADWSAAFAPYIADGSFDPEAAEAMWDALAEWDEYGDGFEIIADFDVDAGEGNYF